MISFENYINSFDGTKVKNEADFNRLSKTAQRYIKSVIAEGYSEKDIEEGVYALCDILLGYEARNGIKSESVDGVCVTYVEGHLQRQMYNTLKLYIPSRLLYRGLT